ncbi:MAG: peptidylprolyl isomerase [Candidatus Woesearchaeota archaeon]
MPRKRHKKLNLVPWVVGIILLALVVIAVIRFYQPAKSEIKSGVLATVNGQPVYASEIDDLYNRLPAQYTETISRENLLNQTIARDLLLQEAAKEGIVVADDQVNELIDSLLEQSGMNRDQLSEQLKLRNLTVDDMVEEYRMQMQLNSLLNKTVYSRIEVTDVEITAFYEQNKDMFELVRASHILVNSSEQAESLLDMIRKGAGFSDIAKTYSLDSYSAEQGGDLDYFTRSQMVPEFSDAAFSLDVGEVSDVVPTDYGYHIIKVTAKKLVPFQEARQQIEPSILRQKESAAALARIKELWSQAEIVFY